MNPIKKIKAVAVIAGLMLCASLTVHAQAATSYFTPNHPIASSGTTSTNAHPALINTNGVWPVYIGGGDIVTNMTKIDVSGSKDLAFQLTSSTAGAIGGVTGQQVVLTLYQSVSGGAPANWSGTNVYFTAFAKITNSYAASTAANTPQTTILPVSEATLAGVPYVYAGIIDASTITNSTVVTNYTLTVFQK